MSAYGDCDCCDRKNVALAQAWIAGLETWACAVCRGEEPDEMNYVIFNSSGKSRFVARRQTTAMPLIAWPQLMRAMSMGCGCTNWMRRKPS